VSHGKIASCKSCVDKVDAIRQREMPYCLPRRRRSGAFLGMLPYQLPRQQRACAWRDHKHAKTVLTLSILERLVTRWIGLHQGTSHQEARGDAPLRSDAMSVRPSRAVGASSTSGSSCCSSCCCCCTCCCCWWRRRSSGSGRHAVGREGEDGLGLGSRDPRAQASFALAWNSACSHDASVQKRDRRS